MHLSKIPSGRWRAIVQTGGQRRSTTGETTAEATRRGHELHVAMGSTPATSTMTVAELLDDHLATNPLRHTSLLNYRVTRAKLPTTFEGRLVGDVTPPVIDVLYRTLEVELSAHQIRKLHSFLSGAFRCAVRGGLVPVNPCREAAVPAEPERDDATPSTADLKALLGAAANFPVTGRFVTSAR